jgi:phospholipase C
VAGPADIARATALCAIVLMVGGTTEVSTVPMAVTPAWGPQNVPIQHVIVITMENHAFDNYFGTYCLKISAVCPQVSAGIPNGTCVPLKVYRGCVKPYAFPLSKLRSGDPPHDFNGTVDSIDHGRMDGFYLAEGKTNETFGHYNGSTIPIYWDLAQEYGLGDRFFSSATSWSLPNHWYEFAGQAPAVSINMSKIGSTSTVKHTYLNESNTTETVQDLLNRTPSVSWRFYDWKLLSYRAAIAKPAFTGAYDAWNPLQARHETYTTAQASHFEPRSAFFREIKGSSFPNVSWIIPTGNNSDHPPNNLSNGETYVATIVDSVERSSYWKSTAIFLTWDDYGGFYDHLAPPKIDFMGLSIRVPMIVISPYTPAGTVVSSLGYFESLLKFIEWRFNLGCITPRDCNAPLPLGYFNFNMTARAPITFPTNWTQDPYPFDTARESKYSHDYVEIDPAVWDPPDGIDTDPD